MKIRLGLHLHQAGNRVWETWRAGYQISSNLRVLNSRSFSETTASGPFRRTTIVHPSPHHLLLYDQAKSTNNPPTMTEVIMDQVPPILHGPSDKEKKYDRQLRLWAASGQQALEDAHLLLLNFGAGTVGVETLKNLVLPGKLPG